MSEKKPLELKIYPPRPMPSIPDGRLDDPAWDDWEDAFEMRRRAMLKAHRKRLTEPELAAEYHQALGEANLLMMAPRRAGKMTAANRVNTLLRFATTPHYFEAAA